MNKKQIKERGLVLYFAYGSNMNPDRMRERGVTFYSRQHLILPGYHLRFNKITITPNAGAANIVPDEKSAVEGILYTITLKGVVNLDKYEHYPSEYNRVTLKVSPDEGYEREIIAYIAQPHKTSEGLKPKREYLNHLFAAETLLSEDYFYRLKRVETFD